ncbi:Uncharacterized protein conserved in bacteria [Salmonella enterica]|uniref:Uncharacterized protein conserved in bacteria n=1 Tax=Salmonella enterica TaxID=28901 RepID=A0A379QJZ1_SALER|nr:Uncharacterized protein conserved in bacteria [Salmonella enterica]
MCCILIIHNNTRGQHHVSRKPYSDETRTLNLRIKPAERDLIDRAAKARGKNRTDFVLEAARAAAEEALIEQRIIMADPEACQAFLTRLDQAPALNAALRKTMQTSAPWEQKK